uniref:galactose-specific lectin nattectin-like n=1 Tax=Semicossyphus pulcher TaxID=241346 RepID=UPI0037E7899B
MYNHSVGDGCEKCPPGWTKFDTRCFQFHFKERDWADAEYHCTSIGGNLASIQTTGEYTFLRDLIYTVTNSHKTTWVGGNDAVKEGVWLWSDGKHFGFSGWGKGEPSNHGGEGCMEMNFREKDYINDAKCQEKNSFVCARDADTSALIISHPH